MNDDVNMREDERVRNETGEIPGTRTEERDDDDTEEITEHSRTRTGAGE
jgi:hypothetical protein